MTTNSKPIEVVGKEGLVNTNAERIGQADVKKARGLFGRIKHLIGKVAVVDEDWMFKSKDWPYLWNHKDTNNKA